MQHESTLCNECDIDIKTRRNAPHECTVAACYKPLTTPLVKKISRRSARWKWVCNDCMLDVTLSVVKSDFFTRIVEGLPLHLMLNIKKNKIHSKPQIHGNRFRYGAAPHCEIRFRASAKPRGSVARATSFVYNIFYVFCVNCRFSPPCKQGRRGYRGRRVRRPKIPIREAKPSEILIGL